jgi:hypothetical protein
MILLKFYTHSNFYNWLPLDSLGKLHKKFEKVQVLCCFFSCVKQNTYTVHLVAICTVVQLINFDVIQIVTDVFLKKILFGIGWLKLEKTFWKLVENIHFLERTCAVTTPNILFFKNKLFREQKMIIFSPLFPNRNAPQKVLFKKPWKRCINIKGLCNLKFFPITFPDVIWALFANFECKTGKFNVFFANIYKSSSESFWNKKVLNVSPLLFSISSYCSCFFTVLNFFWQSNVAKHKNKSVCASLSIVYILQTGKPRPKTANFLHIFT